MPNTELLQELAYLARSVAKRYEGDVQQAFRTFAALLDRAAEDWEGWEE